MAFRQNNPLSRKTSPINRDWIKGAIKRPGAFRKKAEEAGMSTKAFAEKVTANKEDYSARTGKQAELAETLMGMSRHKSGHKNPEQGDFDYEDPNYKDTPEYKKFKRKQKRQERKNKPKRGEAGFEQDEQEAYYENKSDKMDKKKGVSRESSLTKARKKNVKKKPVNKEALAKRKKIIEKVRKEGEAKVSASVSRKSSPANFGDFDFDTTTGKRKKVVDPMDYITSLAPSSEPKKSRPTPSKATSVSSLSGEGINKVGSEINAKPVKVSPPKKKLTQADLDKGKSTAKSKGIVDAGGREGTNRQERKKRRQERRSIRKDKTLSASQKKMAVKESRQQQKDNIRGVKKEAPLSRNRGGKRNPYTNSPMGDLSGNKVYGPATAAIAAGKGLVEGGKKVVKKAIDIHPFNPKSKTHKTIKKGVKAVGKKVKSLTEGVVDFAKNTRKVSGTGGPSRKNCKYKK
jgi:hypothetical protein